MKPLVLALLAASGLLACKKDALTTSVEAVIGQPFDLAPQQTATLPAPAGSISVTLKAVRDSRCPVGVQCLLAGYATVDVELADASAAVQTARISLHTKTVPNYSADSVRVTLNQRPYSLQLLDVTPYPGVENGNPTKLARLRLLAR
ncbi:MAG: hypothetical protein EOO59_06000 [Hymenobacter sp.]|nr:MAG: hypothetical protein EOO59_06000 [Hymenobacter sp.]